MLTCPFSRLAVAFGHERTILPQFKVNWDSLFSGARMQLTKVAVRQREGCNNIVKSYSDVHLEEDKETQEQRGQ